MFQEIRNVFMDQQDVNWRPSHRFIELSYKIKNWSLNSKKKLYTKYPYIRQKCSKLMQCLDLHFVSFFQF